VSVVFNAPPGWPPPPMGWLPPPGWSPPREWPDAPSGWTFYFELVPSNRSRSAVRTAWGRADQGYVGAGAPVPRIIAYLRRHSMVAVPVALVSGVLALVVLLGWFALSANSLESMAVQSCTGLLDDAVAHQGTGPSARGSGRSVVVDDVRTAAPTLIVVTGTYRTVETTWAFTCPVSTAAGSPVVGEIDVNPIAS